MGKVIRYFTDCPGFKSPGIFILEYAGAAGPRVMAWIYGFSCAILLAAPAGFEPASLPCDGKRLSMLPHGANPPPPCLCEKVVYRGKIPSSTIFIISGAHFYPGGWKNG